MFLSSYRTLKISPGSSKEKVREAYVRLVRRYPPEHFPDKFRKIQFAYDELSLAEEIVAKAYASVGRMRDSYSYAGFFLGDHLELPQDPEFNSFDSLLTADRSIWERNRHLLNDINPKTVVFRKPK
jgi:curved DNA-binding protein CbpA